MVDGIPKPAGENPEDAVKKVLEAVDKMLVKETYWAHTGQRNLWKCPLCKNASKKITICKWSRTVRKNNMIYSNDDLNTEIQELFTVVRKLKSDGFKYVWCNGERVFAKKEDESETIGITNVERSFA